MRELSWSIREVVNLTRARKLTRVRPVDLSVATPQGVSTSKKLVGDPHPFLILFSHRHARFLPKKKERKREDSHASDS
jgi:hypothetical protein